MPDVAPRVPWLPWLDGWRGVSILLVLVGHLTPFESAAGLGVEMFFVLSGRLMAELLIVRAQPLPTFLWRRVVRVWPALWVYVALITAALTVSWCFGDQRHALAGAVAALTFTANYASAHVSMPYYDHSWSLAVEEHGYLLLALVVLLARRRAPVAAAVTLVLAMAAMANGIVQTQLLGHDTYYTYLQSDVRAAAILLPFALHLGWKASASRAGWLAVPALLVGATLELGAPGPIRYGAGMTALAIAVVTLDDAPVRLRAWLSAVPLRWAGLAAFSLYLWQQPFMLLHRAGVSSLLCLLGAVSLGIWSYRRIERPSRGWLLAGGAASLLGRIKARFAMDPSPARP